MTVAGQTRRLLELVDRAERTGSRGDWLAAQRASLDIHRLVSERMRLEQAPPPVSLPRRPVDPRER
jgi:hypothetical protein